MPGHENPETPIAARVYRCVCGRYITVPLAKSGETFSETTRCECGVTTGHVQVAKQP